MRKLEVFDSAMCCPTGICGNNADSKLVTFASDLEWLKKQGVEVVRYGLSFEPAEFTKNEDVKKTLQCCGNSSLPILVVDKKLVSKSSYPSRAKLAELCNVEYNEQEAPPIHREGHCCCGEDCDCGHIEKEMTKNHLPKKDCTPEEMDCCKLDNEGKKSDIGDKSKKIILIIVVLLMAGIIAVKLSCLNKAGAVEVKPKVHKVAATTIGETLDSLDQISTSQGVAFIYIPKKTNDKVNSKTKSAMLAAQKTLKSKNVIASLYTLYPNSLEYPQIASKTKPPAVLTLYKGKGKSYLFGNIDQKRLLQSYAAATKDGTSGAACPCSKK